ncbi:hypothetical protein BGX27_010679 [Mortierella sp. AM989]|nr:hypothetical protein BGX27_010679 [Mortierella sp. AM989]
MSNEKSGIPQSQTCSSSCKKSRRHKSWGRLLGLILLGYVLYSFFDSKDNHHRGRHLNTDSEVFAGHQGSKDVIYDSCRQNAVDWDGPSTFETQAQNFQLRFGKGKYSSHVQIHTGSVTKPTLRVGGKISPEGNDHIILKGDETARLGLHIEIKETENLFDVFIWFEDRTVDDGWRKYPACALLDISIILPETYIRYSSILVDGAVTSIDAHDLDSIAFDKLDLETAVGHITTTGEVFVDEFLTRVSTGKTEIESVQVTEKSEKALNVKVSTNTGHVAVGVKTASVGKDEGKHHSIDISSNTGSVKVDITPSPSTDSAKNPGHLDVKAQTRTGSVKSTIQLASTEQNLYLTSGSGTGSVDAFVSDVFSGHFKVETRTGSARVQEAPGSDSHISYEKQTTQFKSGIKIFEGDDSIEDQPQIDLRTGTGRASLVFTN